MKKLYDDKNIHDIAEAIREKRQSEDTYLTSEMAEAIRGIQGGGGAILEEGYADAQPFTETYYPSEGVDGFSSFTVWEISTGEFDNGSGKGFYIKQRNVKGEAPVE